MIFNYKPHTHRAFGSYCPNKASEEAATINTEPSLTQQHFKDEVDTNTIVQRFLKTGQLPLAQEPHDHVVDMCNIPTFQQSLDLINEAKQLFLALPVPLLQRFNYDPNAYLRHMENVAAEPNAKRKQRLLDELRDLGADIPAPPPPNPPPPDSPAA